MASVRLRRLGTVAAAVAVAAAPTAAAHGSDSAAAAKGGVHVAVRGLTGPFQVSFAPSGKIWVANDGASDVVRAPGNGGNGTVVFKGASNISGVVPVSATKVYLVLGAGDPGQKRQQELAVGNPTTGKWHKVADLLAYEKANNPDGQKQSTGKNSDTLSNPYFGLKTTHDILIADAGANDILAYNGVSLHTYHVFPNIRDTKVCKNAPNNDKKHPGCDPVPTGLARGPNGNLYVSLLAGEAPNSGQIQELDMQTGSLIHTWRGFSAPTGVAVGPDGSIYVSQATYNLNEQTPNPNTAGRIVRIHNGHRTVLQVPTPSGLAWHGSRLYASGHSLDFMAQIKNSGVVYKINPSAFHKK